MNIAELIEALRVLKAREDRARRQSPDLVYRIACRNTDQAQAALNRALRSAA